MKRAQQKKEKKGNYWKKILYSCLAVLFCVLIGYRFTIPSVLLPQDNKQNTVFVSSKIDAYESVIYFAHFSESGEGEDRGNMLLQLPIDEPLVTVLENTADLPTALFSDFFGTIVDEVVVLDEPLQKLPDQGSPEQQVSMRQPLSRFFLKSALQAAYNLKFSQALKLLELHYISSKSTVQILEKSTDITTKNSFKDKKFITTPSRLLQECEVSVLNATTQPGVARKKADLLENAGMLVMRIADTQEKKQKTQIYSSDSCKALANTIAKTFVQEPEFFALEKLENAANYRAKVVVFIGGEP